MKLRISILLIFFVLSEALLAVAPSTLYIYLKRIRTSETYEVYRVRIGFTYNSADAFSEGENSDATLNAPFLESSITEPVSISSRNERASFVFDLPLESITDVNGNWNLLINTGSTDDEDLSFTLAGIDLSDFDDYEAFPEIEYDGTYNDLFLRSGTSGTSSSVSFGWTSQTEIEGGTVYRYPEGGPYKAETNDYTRDIGSFPLINGADQTLTDITIDYMDSISRIHFFVSQEPVSLNSRLSINKNDGEVTFTGMKVDTNYILEKTENLAQWNLIDEFTSQSNTLILDLNEIQSNEFFRITETP